MTEVGRPSFGRKSVIRLWFVIGAVVSSMIGLMATEVMWILPG